MGNVLLTGHGRHIDAVDEGPWRERLGSSGLGDALGFMTPDHHRVRNFAVRSLPACDARGLPIERVARALNLSLEVTVSIAAELERHLFFLVQRNATAITWAFPITVDPTPHRLRFGEGATVFGA